MLRKALASLPQDLDETYSRILNSIDESYQQYAIKILNWLCCSLEPLRLADIVKVVAVDTDENPFFDAERCLPEPHDVLVICSSLVSIRTKEKSYPLDNTEYISLSHFSVQEYLLSERITGPNTIFHVQRQSANALIAETCLGYLLSSDESKEGDEKAWAKKPYYDTDIIRRAERTRSTPLSYETRNCPLLTYAAMHWTEHTRLAKENSEKLRHLGRMFFLNRKYVSRRWMEHYHLTILDPLSRRDIYAWKGYVNLQECLDYKESCKPLYIASLEGLPWLASDLLDNGAEVNAKHGFPYETAVRAAVARNHPETIRILIDHGADINYSAVADSTVTALASLAGSVSIMQMLLDSGANINDQDRYWGNALQPAAYQGNVSLVEFLLSKSVDVNAQGNEGGMALTAASSGAHESIVRLLLSAGANINADSEGWGTALISASTRGHESIVRLLLSAGADVNAYSEIRETPLMAASGFNKDASVVQLLLAHNANVNAIGGVFGTALNSASFYGNLDAVRILLDGGADVNARERQNKMALEYAIGEGKWNVSLLLLESGAREDVDAPTELYKIRLKCLKEEAGGAADTLNERMEKAIGEKGGVELKLRDRRPWSSKTRPLLV